MTSRGGLFVFAKFLDCIGLHKILEKDLSLSIRKRGKQTKQPIISGKEGGDVIKIISQGLKFKNPLILVSL